LVAGTMVPWVGTARFGCAVQHVIASKEVAFWNCAVRPSLKAIQHGFVAAAIDREHRSTPVVTRARRSIERPSDDRHATDRSTAVTGSRKIVQHCFAAGPQF